MGPSWVEYVSWLVTLPLTSIGVAPVGADLRLFARAEWRARWRSQLLSALIVAATVATVVAMLLGAYRSHNAFDRLRAATEASDLIVLPSNGSEGMALSRATALGLPGVIQVSAHGEPFVRPRGSQYMPDFNLYPVVRLDATSGTVDTGVITSGREVDPTQPDEIVVSEKLAKDLKLHAGDRLGLESMSDAWVDVAFSGGDPGAPDGPVIDATVVGITRTPADFSQYKGLIEVTPAYIDAYGSQLRVYRSVRVRLSPGTDPTSLTRSEDPAITVSPFGDRASTDDGLDTIAKALRIVAISAALAGLGAIVIAYNRACRVALQDRSVLAAMGWSPRRQQVAAALALAPAMTASIPIGTALGVLLSRDTLVGLAARIDPHPRSIEIDWAIVGTVLASAVAIGLLVLLLSARRVTNVRTLPVADVPARGLWRPLSMSIGVRQAFFAAPRFGGRASRAALAIATVSVAAIVAALSVSASIANLSANPALTGQGDHSTIDSGEALDAFDRAFPLLEHDDRVAMLTGLHVLYDISADSVDDVTAIAFEIVRGDPGFSLVRGRAPHQPDEVAVGPKTLQRLGKQVGRTVTLIGPKGPANYSIVGAMLFPEGDFSHDDGIALTVDGAERIAGDIRDAASLHQVTFNWARGVDAVAAESDLTTEGFQVLTRDDGLAPAAVTNLQQVRSLPIALAIFLGLLALGSLTQAVATSTKMQQREFATLRALGAKSRTVAVLVAIHALVIAVVAIAIGTPAGTVMGAQVWRPIADSANVVVDTIEPWQWILTMVGVAFVATAFLITPLAVNAKRTRPARSLRME